MDTKDLHILNKIHYKGWHGQTLFVVIFPWSSFLDLIQLSKIEPKLFALFMVFFTAFYHSQPMVL